MKRNKGYGYGLGWTLTRDVIFRDDGTGFNRASKPLKNSA
jgi:hypothetical protein